MGTIDGNVTWRQSIQFRTGADSVELMCVETIQTDTNCLQMLFDHFDSYSGHSHLFRNIAGKFCHD